MFSIKMKRWILRVLLALIVAIIALFVAKRVTENNLYIRNVRADANWFIFSIKTQNNSNTNMHLAKTEMGASNLTQAIVTHAESINTTDLDTAEISIERRGGELFATIHCADNVLFIWKSFDGGDFWYIHDVCHH